MSPIGMRGMLGVGMPVATSPTTATPSAARSRTVESTIPTTSADEGAGDPRRDALQDEDRDHRADPERRRGRHELADLLRDRDELAR